MLAPHAVDIAVTISSLIASLCFTFAEPFDDIFLFVKSSCALVSRNTNKSLRPKEGRKEWPTDRPSEWIRARSLNSYFAFCKIIVKKSAFVKCSKITSLNMSHFLLWPTNGRYQVMEIDKNAFSWNRPPGIMQWCDFAQSTSNHIWSQNSQEIAKFPKVHNIHKIKHKSTIFLGIPA